MSVLSDRDIRAELEAGRVRIDPYDPADLQPSSVDLHLDRSFRVFRNNRYAFIDPRMPQPDLTEMLTIADDEPFILHPGEFVLGQTVEWVELPDDLVARLEGKSSLGRLGLLIHSTAGYVDPGWKGTLTLELSNVANLPIALYYGMRIGQISFFRMSSSVERPYGSKGLGSKYQGQSRADRLGLPCGLRARAPGARGGLTVGINDAVHWRAELGGGTTVALVQAGTFRTDSGAILGPVPWILWRPWAEGELDADRRLTQALNCLLVETPAGRVLIETGIGERLDAKNVSMRGYEGTPIVPTLVEAGFDPGVRGHRGHEPPPLRPRRRPAARRRHEGLPAGADRRAAPGVGDRPGRQQPSRGAPTTSRSCAWSRTGVPRAGRRGTASCSPASRSSARAATRRGTRRSW